MTYDEFVRINREEGIPQDYIKGIWDSKPSTPSYDDLKPESVRFAARCMTAAFQQVKVHEN